MVLCEQLPPQGVFSKSHSSVPIYSFFKANDDTARGLIFISSQQFMDIQVEIFGICFLAVMNTTINNLWFFVVVVWGGRGRLG